MGRGGLSRRWIAASGGVLINGLILAALVLIEEPPPVVEEAPMIILDLERPDRQKPPSKRPSAASRSPSFAPREASDQPAISDDLMASTETGPKEQAASSVDPQWRVDPKALDRWKLTEGAPAANWGRYYRACMGLSSEHLTPDERERCMGGWRDRPDTRRPSPNFVGPIDERHWEVPEPKPPSRYDEDEARKQRCRDYRRGRTPGFAERNLSTGSPPPSLSEGGCF